MRRISPTGAGARAAGDPRTEARGTGARDRIRRPYVAWLVPVLLAGGCTGATLGSGVGDAVFRRSPYYAGERVAREGASIGHLPIAYQRGGSQEPIFDPGDGSGSAVASLLAEMNTYLDSLDVTVPVTVEAPLRGTPPDVRFGCETDAVGDCTMEGPGAMEGDRPLMRLEVGRPSAEWVSGFAGALDGAGVDRALVLTLEVGQYWPRQKNFRGEKEVELGTDHAASLPWLTALDAPISVLQLTGAIVGRDGRAARIGAEGLLARRTDIVLSGFGAQALIRDEDVERIRTQRREDLPGQPLAWQVALRTLVGELTGRPELGWRASGAQRRP